MGKKKYKLKMRRLDPWEWPVESWIGFPKTSQNTGITLNKKSCSNDVSDCVCEHNRVSQRWWEVHTLSCTILSLITIYGCCHPFFLISSDALQHQCPGPVLFCVFFTQRKHDDANPLCLQHSHLSNRKRSSLSFPLI